MIAPQFPFYNVFNVPFLGTSLWLSKDLVDRNGIYLQGAMFPAGFFAGMESGSVETFVNDYQYGFDSTPEILAASGYDTIRLIRKILSDDNVRTRLDFQQALLEESDFSGVTGRVTFDETGEVEKSPLLLTIHGSRLHVIN